MGVQYNNAHSITFIDAENDGTINGLRRSWYDLHLIPVKRPSINSPTPNVTLIDIPGSRTRLDLTDVMPGGLTFGRRKGSWDFYIITDRFNSVRNDWAYLKNDMSRFFSHFGTPHLTKCILEDDHSTCYTGTFSVGDLVFENGYPKITIEYDLFYQTSSNIYTYSLKPNLLSILSSLNTSHPIYLGDPRDSVRPWVTTTAYYDNGDEELVDVEPFGDGLLETLGTQTIITHYDGKSSSITFIVVEGEIVGLESRSITGSDEIWQGTDKDDIREYYNTYIKYSNGYSGGDPIVIDHIDGVFSALGYNDVSVSYNGITGTITPFIKRYESLYAYYGIEDYPAYMRIGDYSFRMSSFIRVFGVDNRGHRTQLTYGNNIGDNNIWNIPTKRFLTEGIDTFVINASNNALGEYNQTLTLVNQISIIEAFDIIESWDVVNRAIANGTYRTRFKIGDLIWITISGVYDGYAQIVAFDKDLDEFGRTIPITWMLKETLNPSIKYDNDGNDLWYNNSDIRAYVDGLELSFPQSIQSMLVPSYKEYGANIYDGSRNKLYLKLWIPSVYEITGDTDYRKASGEAVKYDDFFTNETERIKFRNYLNMNPNTLLPQYINAMDWWLRDWKDLAVGYSSVLLYYSSKYGEISSQRYTSTTARYATIGFCTDSTIYDENPAWVLERFKDIFFYLEYYKWDTFGLDTSSTLNYVPDAVEAEIDEHVVYNPTQSTYVLYPAITFTLTSQTDSNYIYDVNIYDYSNPSEIVALFESRFNMVQNSVTSIDNYYIFNFTMTTNKNE